MDVNARRRTASDTSPFDTLRLPKPEGKDVKRHSIHGITEEVDKIKPHQEIARLSIQEKQFLLAVERGDIALTNKILAENVNKSMVDDEWSRSRDFNVNCVDPLGRSAVMIAIENENLEILKILIENAVDTKEALLCAISEEFVEAVELLFEYEEKHHEPDTPYSWESAPNNTSMFTPDITPLVLAAHRDNYEIIKILLDKGASLPVPHDVKCGCEECVKSLQADCLQHSYSRINAYRALSSPSLIALSSKDPILTAFELSWELRRLSRLEHEFKSEYEMLKDKCQDFATALLDHTRTSNELQILLNHNSYATDSKQRDQAFNLARLKLAVKLKQKKFVAHPNVQQLLASIWYAGLPGFRRKNGFLQFWEVICIGLMFPLLSIIYIIAPYSSMGLVLRKPFIKFICHSASYFTFLFLLLLTSIKISGTLDDVFWAEWLIMFWVFGFIWSEIKQVRSCGFKEYITNLWNILDIISNSFYVCTIILRIVYYITRSYYNVHPPENKIVIESISGVHEALFSMANIMSALKLVYIFSINPYLGPLQIMLSRMVLDIVKFFFLYILVLFAFACGVYQLLGDFGAQKNNGTAATDDDGKDDKLAFGSLFDTIQTLFWSAFGVMELENVTSLDTIDFIKFWGLLTWGTFCVISIVVLLNLLIAMMSTSYQNITDAADIEWKYARSKLWISYFEEGGTTPPPFNIIPTPKSCWQLLLKSSCCRSRKPKFDMQQQLKTQLSINEFQNTVRNLVHRYIMAMQKRFGDHTVITVDDINEVRQDISSFRFELLNTLQNSGMKINTANDSPVGLTTRKDRKKPRLFKGFDNESDSFSGSNIWPDDTTVPLSPQVEIAKKEHAKFTLSGILPSIFQTKQTPKSTPNPTITTTTTNTNITSAAVTGDGGNKNNNNNNNNSNNNNSSGSSSNSGNVGIGGSNKKNAGELNKPWLHIKGKAESLEKLIEKGLVTKYILRTKNPAATVLVRDSSERPHNNKQQDSLYEVDNEDADVETGLRKVDDDAIEIYASSSENYPAASITISETETNAAEAAAKELVITEEQHDAAADGRDANAEEVYADVVTTRTEQQKDEQENKVDTEEAERYGKVEAPAESKQLRKASSGSQKHLKRQEMIEEQNITDRSTSSNNDLN